MKITNCIFKDDSFRTFNWKIKTGSAYTTNGDEITIPNGTTIMRPPISPLPIPFSASDVYSIDFRAKNDGIATSTLTIYINYPGGGPPPLPLVTQSITNSVYVQYSIPISSSSTIDDIEILSAGSGTIIDYISFTALSGNVLTGNAYDFIDQGGSALDIEISKKTVSQSIPNSIDIIQQLGISSRTIALTLPKVQKIYYNWLEDKLKNNIAVEFVSPTLQATGYLTDVQASTDAGTVSQPYEGGSAVPLYDVSCTLIKGDVDMDAVKTTM